MKLLGLQTFIKGGPGSGNYDGPGQPRFVRNDKYSEVSMRNWRFSLSDIEDEAFRYWYGNGNMHFQSMRDLDIGDRERAVERNGGNIPKGSQLYHSGDRLIVEKFVDELDEKRKLIYKALETAPDII